MTGVQTCALPILQDGQNLFDPKTSSFGVDWQADENADSLIRDKIIVPIIIVGIYNTSDRSLEYTPTQKGIAYMKFVVNKLKPFIDKTFRTLPGRDFTSVGGSSYGGTISFMLVWYYSKIFSKAACFSPAFKTNRFDLTTVVKNYHGIKKDIELYIDIGGIGLEKKLQPGIDEMISSLKKKRYKLNEDYFWFKDSTARHFEADWAKRFWQPLEIFFNYNKFKKNEVESLFFEKNIKINFKTLFVVNQKYVAQSAVPFIGLVYRHDIFDIYNFSNVQKIFLSGAISAETELSTAILELKANIRTRFSSHLYFNLYYGTGVFSSFKHSSTNQHVKSGYSFGPEVGYIFNPSSFFLLNGVRE